MNKAFDYDIAFIGCGPGGYTAAIKAAQLGYKVICYDEKEVGGTCLNRGCIPSKFLLNASHYYSMPSFLNKFGIKCNGMTVNMHDMQTANLKNIRDFQNGIKSLFRKNNIKFIQQKAFIGDAHTVITEDGKNFNVNKIIIATGSKVSELPGFEVNNDNIINSDQALFIEEIPERIAIIGGGVIGVEFASIWSRLGSEVHVIEFMDEILPGMDKEIRQGARKIFEKQKIKFKLNYQALESKIKSGATELTIKNRTNDQVEKLIVDRIIVCVGRKPNIDIDHLTKIGIKVNQRGFIEVDDNLETSIKGVFAIGDTIAKGPMLAHKAEEDGIYVIEKLNGQKPHLDYNLVPSVIYTHPEIAAIGKTENDLKEQNIPYKIGKFPFMANSRAKTCQDYDGFVKIITHAEYDTILGAHIIGPQAGTLIGELSVAMHYGASAEDLARVCHSHPDLNETIKEACLAAYFKAIHI